MLQRVGQRPQHKEARPVADRHRPLVIAVGHGLEETLDAPWIAPALLQRQEDEALRNGQGRQGRRHQQRPHDRSTLGEDAHNIELLRQRLQRASARRVQWQSAAPGAEQRAQAGLQLAIQGSHHRLGGTCLGDHRAHDEKLPFLDRPVRADRGAVNPHAADRRGQPRASRVDHGDLTVKTVIRGERRVAGRLLRRLQDGAQRLQFADGGLGFVGPAVLVQ